ncbi:hypothetical protein SLEP1_g59735, partial [Rubroshorea leprosula]
MLFYSVLKRQRKTTLNFIIVFHVLVFMSGSNVQGKCRTGCDLALASYYFGDTYDKVAQTVYTNLTTENWVHRFNIYDDTRILDYSPINVTVKCSCGDRRVSKDYGLFTTYPLRQGDNLSTVAAEAGVSMEILISSKFLAMVVSAVSRRVGDHTATVAIDAYMVVHS